MYEYWCDIITDCVYMYRSWLSKRLLMLIARYYKNDEGVQFDFKKLFIKVAEKEVCQTKCVNANNTLKFYRSQITRIIIVKISTLRLNFVLMVLNTAGNTISAFFHFQ